MLEQNNEFENILAVLHEIDKTASFNVFIPSLKKEVKFKQLNTEQLKLLFKTNLEGTAVYNTKFILLLNEIIYNNCLEPNIDINKLTILDKFLIIFKTRIESISPEYNFVLTDKEKEIYNTEQSFAVFNLKDNYDNFVKQQPNFPSVIFSKDEYEVTIGLPTIDIESKFESDLFKNINFKITSEEDLQNILANTFVNEIAKYIQSIKINNSVIDFNEYDFKTAISIVEKLPAVIVNEVLKYIENYKNLITTLTTCDVVLQNNEHLFKEVPINIAFFNI